MDLITYIFMFLIWLALLRIIDEFRDLNQTLKAIYSERYLILKEREEYKDYE